MNKFFIADDWHAPGLSSLTQAWFLFFLIAPLSCFIFTWEFAGIPLICTQGQRPNYSRTRIAIMKPTTPQLFQDDEQLAKIDKLWSVADLLAQPAVFFLKDVCSLLEITAASVLAHAKRLHEQGQDAYAVMGLRKVWNHWYVRMKVFAPYYQAHFMTNIRRIRPGMDTNTLLNQEGIFLLSQVCKCIPFTSNQLRHQARVVPVEVCGIFKQEGTYLVHMEIFGQWLSRLWQTGFDSLAAESSKQAPAVQKSESRKS